jgi:hypothetical protein
MGYHFSHQHRHDQVKRAPLDAEVQLTRWALIRNATPISGLRRLRDHADQVVNISLGNSIRSYIDGSNKPAEVY